MKITSILDPLMNQMTHDQDRITEIFTRHHEAKTHNASVDKESAPVMNSPKMFQLADKYGYDLHEAFPPHPDNKKDNVTISMKEMKKLVTSLKSDTSPGKSRVDKYMFWHGLLNIFPIFFWRHLISCLQNQIGKI